MEFIKYQSQFEKMIDNKIIGMPILVNSEVNFRGKNNILVCDNNLKLENVILEFKGDNSIVYLSSNLNDSFKLEIYNNSTLFVGKNTKIGLSVTFNVLESKNLIIGDECIIGNNVTITTAKYYPIYDSNSKHRLNFPGSVYIGDHVWLGDYSFISEGVKIGSGVIVGNYSFIPKNLKIPSNYYLSGNPVQIIKKGVFFINEFSASFKSSDSINFKNYKSNIYIYNVDTNETLSMNNIDEILNDLDVNSRFEFIQKLFIRNKNKNRFSIQ